MELTVGRHQLNFVLHTNYSRSAVCQVLDRHGLYKDMMRISVSAFDGRSSYHKCRNTALDLNEFYEIITIMKGMLEDYE